MADSLVAEAIRRVEGVLDVPGVRITITPDAGQSIGGYGLGGRTYSATEIRLFIDPGYPHLANVAPQRLVWLTTHELHHAARWRSAGYGATLFEAMVSEGMADRFAEELTTNALQPWSRAFPTDSTAHYLARARPEFDSRSYNHARWFFDADPSLPRWTGYTLGYRLVSSYIADHAGTSAATLVSTPASTFRP